MKSGAANTQDLVYNKIMSFMNLRYTGKTIPPPSHCLVLHNIAYGTGDTPLYYAQTFCDTRILNLYVVQNTYSFAEK